uniref:group II intron maturase-specific domain-containing protein n=1 Tax=Oceanispirochaeta sp. TaxID=2035350 RepID=UPI002606B017
YGKQEKLGMVMPQKKKLKKLEDRIRLITRRNRGVRIETVIAELNSIFRGWIGYFARSSMKKYLERLMEWTRRRIRQYLWKQWKNGKNRKHRLRQLGVSDSVLKHWKLGSNSYWKMAGVLNPLLRNEVIHNHFGLLDVAGFYKRLHTKRMEYDRVVLDCRYHSLFG